MQTAPGRGRDRHELAARRRPDGEEEQVDVTGAERLGRRLLDDERAVPERKRRPAERAEANARTCS